jgi:hypothetical protein
VLRCLSVVCSTHPYMHACHRRLRSGMGPDPSGMVTACQSRGIAPQAYSAIGGGSDSILGAPVAKVVALAHNVSTAQVRPGHVMVPSSLFLSSLPKEPALPRLLEIQPLLETCCRRSHNRHHHRSRLPPPPKLLPPPPHTHTHTRTHTRTHTHTHTRTHTHTHTHTLTHTHTHTHTHARARTHTHTHTHTLTTAFHHHHQVALRWFVQRGLPVIARTGSNQTAYMMEDLDIFNWTLTQSEMASLSGWIMPKPPSPVKFMCMM